MILRGLALIVVGTVIAVLGNGLQERIARSIPADAVAKGRVGTPLSVDPKGRDVRVFGGLSSIAGDRLLEGLKCTSSAKIEAPGTSGRYHVTKVGDYSLVGTVSTGKPFELRCRATTEAASYLPLFVTTGGGKAGVAVFPLVGGIIAACFGGGMVIAGLLIRRKRRRPDRELPMIGPTG